MYTSLFAKLPVITTAAKSSTRTNDVDQLVAQCASMGRAFSDSEEFQNKANLLLAQVGADILGNQASSYAEDGLKEFSMMLKLHCTANAKKRFSDAINRLRAIASMRSKKWANALKCILRPGGVPKGLSECDPDSLLMLVDIYDALDRRSNALECAKLAVASAQDHVSKLEKFGDDLSDIVAGPVLGPYALLATSYHFLALQLDVSGYGHISSDWHQRALNVATQHDDSICISLRGRLKDCWELSASVPAEVIVAVQPLQPPDQFSNPIKLSSLEADQSFGLGQDNTDSIHYIGSGDLADISLRSSLRRTNVSRSPTRNATVDESIDSYGMHWKDSNVWSRDNILERVSPIMMTNDTGTIMVANDVGNFYGNNDHTSSMRIPNMVTNNLNEGPVFVNQAGNTSRFNSTRPHSAAIHGRHVRGQSVQFVKHKYPQPDVYSDDFMERPKSLFQAPDRRKSERKRSAASKRLSSSPPRQRIVQNDQPRGLVLTHDGTRQPMATSYLAGFDRVPATGVSQMNMKVEARTDSSIPVPSLAFPFNPPDVLVPPSRNKRDDLRLSLGDAAAVDQPEEKHRGPSTSRLQVSPRRYTGWTSARLNNVVESDKLAHSFMRSGPYVALREHQPVSTSATAASSPKSRSPNSGEKSPKQKSAVNISPKRFTFDPSDAGQTIGRHRPRSGSRATSAGGSKSSDNQRVARTEIQPTNEVHKPLTGGFARPLSAQPILQSSPESLLHQALNYHTTNDSDHKVNSPRKRADFQVPFQHELYKEMDVTMLHPSELGRPNIENRLPTHQDQVVPISFNRQEARAKEKATLKAIYGGRQAETEGGENGEQKDEVKQFAGFGLGRTQLMYRGLHLKKSTMKSSSTPTALSEANMKYFGKVGDREDVHNLFSTGTLLTSEEHRREQWAAIADQFLVPLVKPSKKEQTPIPELNGVIICLNSGQRKPPQDADHVKSSHERRRPHSAGTIRPRRQLMNNPDLTSNIVAEQPRIGMRSHSDRALLKLHPVENPIATVNEIHEAESRKNFEPSGQPAFIYDEPNLTAEGEVDNESQFSGPNCIRGLIVDASKQLSGTICVQFDPMGDQFDVPLENIRVVKSNSKHGQLIARSVSNVNTDVCAVDLRDDCTQLMHMHMLTVRKTSLYLMRVVKDQSVVLIQAFFRGTLIRIKLSHIRKHLAAVRSLLVREKALRDKELLLERKLRDAELLMHQKESLSHQKESISHPEESLSHQEESGVDINSHSRASRTKGHSDGSEIIPLSGQPYGDLNFDSSSAASILSHPHANFSPVVSNVDNDPVIMGNQAVEKRQVDAENDADWATFLDHVLEPEHESDVDPQDSVVFGADVEVVTNELILAHELQHSTNKLLL